MRETVYDKIFKPKTYTLSNGKEVKQHASRMPFILLIVLFITIVSWEVTGVDLSMIRTRGYQFIVILLAMFPPNLNFMSNVWGPLFDTIQMSLLGSIAGALLAIPFALLSSSNIIRNQLLNGFFKLFLSILRTLPTLVTALIATFIFGLGTMAGTVAIFIFTLSYIGKLMYEHIENVDMGAFEAHESMGLSKVEAFRYAIVPDVMPTYLSVSLYAFEGNIRYAAILGYVGAGGVGLLLDERLGWRDYPSVGMVLLILMLVVFVIERISEYFRMKLT
ncbi:phosphonate ABC transporter, permease protein PhnE [Alkalibacterium sp. 20]|uniref:phosphonate ABC transporter, permease protein PhnE n=1 Tax=Alkalibacterium sp. 20 TaxID=1798803 RepID=UPI0009004810|nr:phosphonate ABC transporter, permease protein PhnE [Alkalibacterium sp. 20]OJF91810.1 phosphonate ABC transporter permease [Alkalibacterium sp. 20]